jgi:hypothetical protein
MKQRFAIIILGMLFCLSCGTNNLKQESSLMDSLTKVPPQKKLAYGIEINIDTFKLGINGYLEQAALSKDKFYFMFWAAEENTGQSSKKMIVTSTKGKFIEEFLLPEEFKYIASYNLTIEQDSLFLKEQGLEEQTFVLGKDGVNFQQIGKRKFQIYQDSLYNVFSTCWGEFGGSIFFQDKKTKEVFEATAQCPLVVNKIAGQYYVTNYIGPHVGPYTSVLKIADPRKLQKLRFDFHKQFDFRTREGSYHKKGVERLLDSIPLYIPTSFVIDNQLLHLYNDDKGTFIGRLEQGKMVPVHSFDFNFNSLFDQQIGDGQQLLRFDITDSTHIAIEVPNSNPKGILLIDEKKLNFYFIK